MRKLLNTEFWEWVLVIGVCTVVGSMVMYTLIQAVQIAGGK